MNASVARPALEPQTLASTTGVAYDVLAAAQARLGFVPQMYANMANAPGLLHTYTTGYEHFRQASGFTPVEQEVVFLTISRFHRCSYCMAAHSRIADQLSKVPAAVLRALRAGTTIPDTQLAALSAFTHAMVESRGEPSPEQVQAFRAAGYTDRHVLEIILAIAVKTLSNYSNHVCTVVYRSFCKFRFAPQAGSFAGRTLWARSARGGCPAKRRGGGMMP